MAWGRPPFGLEAGDLFENAVAERIEFKRLKNRWRRRIFRCCEFLCAQWACRQGWFDIGPARRDIVGPDASGRRRIVTRKSATQESRTYSAQERRSRNTHYATIVTDRKTNTPRHRELMPRSGPEHIRLRRQKFNSPRLIIEFYIRLDAVQAL